MWRKIRGLLCTVFLSLYFADKLGSINNCKNKKVKIFPMQLTKSLSKVALLTKKSNPASWKLEIQINLNYLDSFFFLKVSRWRERNSSDFSKCLSLNFIWIITSEMFYKYKCSLTRSFVLYNPLSTLDLYAWYVVSLSFPSSKQSNVHLKLFSHDLIVVSVCTYYQ